MDKDNGKRKPLGLSIENQEKKKALSDHVHQILSHGRSKSVSVEVKKKKGKFIVAGKEDVIEGSVSVTEQEIRARAVHRAAMDKELEEKKKEEERRLVQESMAPIKEVPDPAIHAPTQPHDDEVIDVVHYDSESDRSGQRMREKHPSSKSQSHHDWLDSDELEDKKGSAKNKKSFSQKKDKKIEETDPYDGVTKSIVGLKKLRSRQKRVRPVSVKKTIRINGSVTVGELSRLLGEKTTALLHVLKSLDISGLDRLSLLTLDQAIFVAEYLGHSVVCHDHANARTLLENQKPIKKEPRSPVVVVMGHVDHGKTSLLDALRHTNVIDKEAGGITQSIGAYRVHLSSGRSITFIDTPGHQAFSKMRSRGANVTDIVILVVAADEGVNEQTIESIQHCRAAGVPMIVAITKIDKPNADPNRVIQQLLTHEVVVEKMGGDVQSVEVSSKEKIGLEALEEAVVLQGELMELSADPTMRPSGCVLETHFLKGHGFATSVLVQQGTLKRGQSFVVGSAWGRVRFLLDESGKFLDSAGSSQPVVVIGFPDTTVPGDMFFVAPSESDAKSLSLMTSDEEEKESVTDDMAFLQSRLMSKDKKTQKILVKADSQGSVEAILHEIHKISQEEILIDVVCSDIGAVSENDVMLAMQSNAIIIQFNVSILPGAQKMLSSDAVVVIKDRIIYNVVDRLRKILSDLLDPVYEDQILGDAKIIQVFQMSGKSTACIAGCLIQSGVMRRGEWARVIRNKNVLFEGKIKSLRHLKDDVKEKGVGYECGVFLEGYSDFKIGDVVQCFSRKRIDRSI